MPSGTDGGPELTSEEDLSSVRSVFGVEPILRELPQFAPPKLPRRERGEKGQRELVKGAQHPEVPDRREKESEGSHLGSTPHQSPNSSSLAAITARAVASANDARSDAPVASGRNAS